ncbi:MAG: hypothetical protein ACYS4W_05505 [Planctomycetota bacterium]
MIIVSEASRLGGTAVLDTILLRLMWATLFARTTTQARSQKKPEQAPAFGLVNR